MKRIPMSGWLMVTWCAGCGPTSRSPSPAEIERYALALTDSVAAAVSIKDVNRLTGSCETRSTSEPAW